MNEPRQTWTVADVMIEDVVSVQPNTTFKELVHLLWLSDVGALPVVDERGALRGIVTESDVLGLSELRARGGGAGGSVKAGLHAKLASASPLTAADVMSSPVVTVQPEDTLADTARLMRARRVRRTPVLDRSGVVVGMVSQLDLLKVFFRSEETVEWDVRDVLKRRLTDPGAVRVRVADGVVHLGGLTPASPATDRLVAALDSLPGVVAVEVSPR